jgi:hypothetical protein
VCAVAKLWRMSSTAHDIQWIPPAGRCCMLHAERRMQTTVQDIYLRLADVDLEDCSAAVVSAEVCCLWPCGYRPMLVHHTYSHKHTRARARPHRRAHARGHAQTCARTQPRTHTNNSAPCAHPAVIAPIWTREECRKCCGCVFVCVLLAPSTLGVQLNGLRTVTVAQPALACCCCCCCCCALYLRAVFAARLLAHCRQTRTLSRTTCICSYSSAHGSIRLVSAANTLALGPRRCPFELNIACPSPAACCQHLRQAACGTCTSG